MTVREWLKDYEWFPQVEHNVEMQGWDTLDGEGVNASEALHGAFIWENTPEGHEFWMKIYENLQQ